MATPQNTLTRLHGLDTLRALAIIAVVLYHLNIQGLLPARVEPVAKIGWVGVDLFFVLSGFLIASQLLRPYLSGCKPSLKDFYARRAYRILPAFVVVLLLYLLWPLWRETSGPYAGWQYASFMWNILLLGYPENHAFSHIWSLCVEEHFYLFFPLLLILIMRKLSVWKAVSALLLFILGGIGLRAWLLHAVVLPAGDQQGIMMMKYIYYPTYSRLDGLVVGASLAMVRTFRATWWSRLTKHSVLLALLGCASVSGALWLCDFGFVDPKLPLSILFTFPTLACGFGLLVASAAADRGILTNEIPGASALAALAYCLYLTHKSVAHAVHRLLPALTQNAGWTSSAIYAMSCLGVAALLHFAIERPFLALRTRHNPGRVNARVGSEVSLDPAI